MLLLQLKEIENMFLVQCKVKKYCIKVVNKADVTYLLIFYYMLLQLQEIENNFLVQCKVKKYCIKVVKKVDVAYLFDFF